MWMPRESDPRRCQILWFYSEGREVRVDKGSQLDRIPLEMQATGRKRWSIKEAQRPQVQIQSGIGAGSPSSHSFPKVVL